MKKAWVFLLAAVVLNVPAVACTTSAPGDASSSESDLRDTDDNEFTNITSAVGNNIYIELFPGGGAVGNCPHTVMWLSYEDTTGFFAGETSLEVWYGVPSGAEKSSATIPMAPSTSVGLEHPTFEAFVCFPHADLPSVNVAFANAAKWDSNDSKNYSYVFTPQEQNPVASVHTAVGNDVGITINLNTSANENCGASPALELLYTDRTHFFGGAGSIGMWVRFHTHDHRDTSHNVTMYGSGGQYTTARFCLSDDEAKAGTLEMAFSDDAKEKWDSNNAQNYFANPVSPP